MERATLWRELSERIIETTAEIKSQTSHYDFDETDDDTEYGRLCMKRCEIEKELPPALVKRLHAAGSMHDVGRIVEDFRPKRVQRPL